MPPKSRSWASSPQMFMPGWTASWRLLSRRTAGWPRKLYFAWRVSSVTPPHARRRILPRQRPRPQHFRRRWPLGRTVFAQEAASARRQAELEAQARETCAKLSEAQESLAKEHEESQRLREALQLAEQTREDSNREAKDLRDEVKALQADD